jgi:membrane protein YdbS with pleckstrin-like domain
MNPPRSGSLPHPTPSPSGLLLAGQPSRLPALALLGGVGGLTGWSIGLMWLFSAPPLVVALSLIWFLFLSFFLVVGAGDLVRRCCIRYSVSSTEVTQQHGLLHRQTKIVLVAKIQNVTVDQGLLGRLANFGTLRIQSAGSGRRSQLSIEDVTRPWEWRSRLLSHTDESRRESRKRAHYSRSGNPRRRSN